MKYLQEHFCFNIRRKGGGTQREVSFRSAVNPNRFPTQCTNQTELFITHSHDAGGDLPVYPCCTVDRTILFRLDDCKLSSLPFYQWFTDMSICTLTNITYGALHTINSISDNFIWKIPNPSKLTYPISGLNIIL